MFCVRRISVSRPALVQTRGQSTSAGATGKPPIPERIAKFRRTVAPIARDHLGVSVPPKFCEQSIFSTTYRLDADYTAPQKVRPSRPTQGKPTGESRLENSPTRQPSRARKLISDSGTYEMVAEATRGSDSQRTKRSVPKPSNRRQPSGDHTPSTRSTSRTVTGSKLSRMASRRPPDTFDAESFVQAQAFSSWRNTEDGAILDGDDVKELRKTMLNYMRARSPAVEAKIALANGNEAAQSPGEFRPFIQTRDPCAAINAFCGDAMPVPWALTRESQPTRPWERTTYTAAPTRSINMQQRAVSQSLNLLAQRMRPIPTTSMTSATSSAGTLLATRCIPASSTIPPMLLSLTERSVGASRGAQVFRRDVLAGDYAMHALVNAKTNNPAMLAAKVAMVSNTTTNLGDKKSAMSLVSRLATP